MNNARHFFEYNSPIRHTLEIVYRAGLQEGIDGFSLAENGKRLKCVPGGRERSAGVLAACYLIPGGDHRPSPCLLPMRPICISYFAGGVKKTLTGAIGLALPVFRDPDGDAAETCGTPFPPPFLLTRKGAESPRPPGPSTRKPYSAE